jgi:hypothetical protein
MLAGSFHSGVTANYGYFPSGGIGLVLVILVILLLFGRI